MESRITTFFMKTIDERNKLCDDPNKMSQALRKYASEFARMGGRAGRGKCKARTSEQARKAAIIGANKRREKKLQQPI